MNKIFILIFLSFFLFCFLFLLLFSLFLFFLHDFSYCSYSLLTIFIFPTFSPYFLPINFSIPLFCIDYLSLPSQSFSNFRLLLFHVSKYFPFPSQPFLLLFSCFTLLESLLLIIFILHTVHSLIRSLVLPFFVSFYFYFYSSLCLIKFPIFSFLLFFV